MPGVLWEVSCYVVVLLSGILPWFWFPGVGLRPMPLAPVEHYVFAFLFSDGTAWVGLTTDIRRRSLALAKSFPDVGDVVCLQSLSTLFSFPGRREVYQWRFRLCREGVRLRTLGVERTYVLEKSDLVEGVSDAADCLVLPEAVARWLNAVAQGREVASSASSSKVARIRCRLKKEDRRRFGPP